MANKVLSLLLILLFITTSLYAEKKDTQDNSPSDSSGNLLVVFGGTIFALIIGKKIVAINFPPKSQETIESDDFEDKKPKIDKFNDKKSSKTCLDLCQNTASLSRRSIGEEMKTRNSSSQGTSTLERMYLNQKGTTIVQPGTSSSPMNVGGVTSGVLRYPHLLVYLENSNLNQEAEVLILGPGMERYISEHFHRISSPHLNEILAYFSQNAQVTVVDIEDFVLSLQESLYSDFEREVAQSVFHVDSGFSLDRLSSQQIQFISRYIDRIPEVIQQHLNIIQDDFAQYSPGIRRFDIIFALQSLMYSIKNVERKEALEIFAKYLRALKDNGVLIIDEFAYLILQNHIKSLPNFSSDKTIIWYYGGKLPFLLKRIPVPNQTVNNENPRIIFTFPGDKRIRFKSTSNIYVIKRLPKD